MLRIILPAIFLTGSCSCSDYHRNANDEYMRLIQRGNPNLVINKIENEKTLQNVEICAPFGGKGILFKMKIDQEGEKLYFHTSSGTFVPYWFSIELPDAHLRLHFTKESKLASTVAISSTVFSLPTSLPSDVLKDAEINAFHLQLMTEGKLDRLLSQPNIKRIHTRLSLAWIKDFLLKSKPVATETARARNYYEQYIEIPVTMDTAVLSKLEQLYQNMKDSRASKDFVDI